MNAKDFAKRFMSGTVVIQREGSTEFKEFCDRIEPYLIRTPRRIATTWKPDMTFYKYCMSGSKYKFCWDNGAYNGVENLKTYDTEHRMQLIDWRKIIFNDAKFEDLL